MVFNLKHDAMKNLIALAVVALAATLSSFNYMGGDTYTVSLNNKQIIKERVHGQTMVPTVSLDNAIPTDEYQVYYSECGQIGKARTLSIRDENNKTLKEFRFADVTGDEHIPMALKAGDLSALQKKGSGKLKLVYVSAIRNDGQLLAYLVFKNNNTAALRN
jgi:hypothetical protein